MFSEKTPAEGGAVSAADLSVFPPHELISHCVVVSVPKSPRLRASATHHLRIVGSAGQFDTRLRSWYFNATVICDPFVNEVALSGGR